MRYSVAGESHGPALTAIVEGVPAGLALSQDAINADLARRQQGYGRGGRQAIETDKATVTSGVRFGKTLGSPITLTVANRDWQNWEDRMAVFGQAPANLQREVTPRPGHADLVGVLKTNSNDCRDILERSSARHTAARVAAGAIARAVLAELGVEVFSYVNRIGAACMSEDDPFMQATKFLRERVEQSVVRCPSEEASQAMVAEIERAIKQKDSLGGTFRVVVTGLVPGVGGYATPASRLSAQLGAALFSIPAIKGVEFGLGFACAERKGSQVHDPIQGDASGSGFTRLSNNAGGLEGGMTTGMPLVVTAAMKPIPTLMQPLETVNLDTLEPASASKERSDVCAVPACAVIAEAEVAFALAQAYTQKFGSDNMADIKANMAAYKQRLSKVASQ